ncbi:PIG-L family deacetylase [Roseiflexus sp.]|uniref:PIG-L family deacetylase n=1 Tax=Roseiflexus sp. TaxID=2562120 RepID=UPI00398B78F0
MSYDVMVISAHPDDAEVQMGGTIALLTAQGKRVLLVDLCDGEPSDFAAPGVRAQQAQRAAAHLGADRLFLDGQDRLIADTIDLRLEVARLIRIHRPAMVFATTDACVHPDHAAVGSLVSAAVFYARLDHWSRVPGGEALGDTSPWAIARLFYPHCKMEPPWGRDFAFAVDVSATYDQKRAAIAEYGSIFKVEEHDRLLTLYEAEDAYIGRLFGVAYAEAFKSQSPLLVSSPTVFLPALHG